MVILTWAFMQRLKVMALYTKVTKSSFERKMIRKRQAESIAKLKPKVSMPNPSALLMLKR